MLNNETFNGMLVHWNNKKQTFCFSLEDARDFCLRENLTDKDAMIIEDIRAEKFYIESQDSASLIRSFEVQHKIGRRAKKSA